MRSMLARALLCFVVAAALASTGCKKLSSQLVIGVVTNLKVSDPLGFVRMDVLRNQVVAQQESWHISDQRSLDFVLPGSFNLYSDNGGSPVIDVTVGGYTDKNAVTSFVPRTVTMQLLEEETLFYRMALVEKCVLGNPAATCADGYGCVEGVCRATVANPRTLKPYAASRTNTIECDSGSRFIDTGTCGSGTCQQLPIASTTCAGNEFCSEGTCYKYDPANPRSLEFAEECSPENNDTCRDSTLACKRTGLAGGSPDPARCRQKCTSNADCTRELPDAIAQGIDHTLAVCVVATGACTYACDPVNAGNSGCLSGTRCQVTTDGTSTIAPDCVIASSTGGTVAVGGACNPQHASDDCAGGSTCVSRNGMPTICLKNCFMTDSSTCPTGTACNAVKAGTTGPVSSTYGVCF